MYYAKITDEQLVRQFITGKREALELLMRRHKNRVFGTIYLFVRDRYVAEDLFQETFIKAFMTLRSGSYQEEGKFLPWLMRIAYNLCIDYYRKVRRTPPVVTSEGFDVFEILDMGVPTPEKELIRKQSHQKIRALIERLPPEQREVVILRQWANLSFKEIALLTGVSINTALGRMRYALINLRKMQKALKLAL